MIYLIAGYGYVGKALYELLKDTFDVGVIDPKYNTATFEQMTDDQRPGAVIVCVGTPQGPDGRCDASAVFDILDRVEPGIPVLIKSTIDLPTWRTIKENYGEQQITLCPEMLRANTAVADVAEVKHLILAGDNQSFWKRFFRAAYKHDIDFITMRPEESIAVKYFENAFLATKVSFFNQISEFCVHNRLNFEKVRQGLAKDERINGDHTNLNDQGKLGWGGHCFPKDTAALIEMAAESNTELSILKAVIEYNRRVYEPGK